MSIHNMGGPPIPIYKKCTNVDQLELLNVDMNVKKMAYDVFVKNTGYTLFDLTKISSVHTENAAAIVNNTSLYVFLAIFAVVVLILGIMMVTNLLSVEGGLHLLLIISIVIYLLSVMYRISTLSNVKSANAVLNQDILDNRAKYEQSIALMPNAMTNIDKVVGN